MAERNGGDAHVPAPKRPLPGVAVPRGERAIPFPRWSRVRQKAGSPALLATGEAAPEQVAFPRLARAPVPRRSCSSGADRSDVVRSWPRFSSQGSDAWDYLSKQSRPPLRILRTVSEERRPAVGQVSNLSGARGQVGNLSHSALR